MVRAAARRPHIKIGFIAEFRDNSFFARVAADTADTTLTPLTRFSAIGQPLAESRAETL
jgi:hypothetical protein